MNKIAVAFAATSLMALAACGEKPAEEANTMASNEVMMNDANVMEAANTMDNAANTMANAANTMENAANAVENEAAAH